MSGTLRLQYGGTFDPFHCGHLTVARAARDELGVPVHLVPAADPPHRAAPGATAAQRVAMLERVCAVEPGLRVDRRELERSGPSFTIDTLRDLRAELGPARPLALLVGADSLVALPSWREWQALFGFTHFVVADRPGSVLDGPLPLPLEAWLAGRWADSTADLATAPAGRVLRLRQPLRPESATEVRVLRASGGGWQAHVPVEVAAYIESEGLYLGG